MGCFVLSKTPKITQVRTRTRTCRFALNRLGDFLLQAFNKQPIRKLGCTMIQLVELLPCNKKVMGMNLGLESFLMEFTHFPLLMCGYFPAILASTPSS